MFCTVLATNRSGSSANAHECIKINVVLHKYCGVSWTVSFPRGKGILLLTAFFVVQRQNICQTFEFEKRRWKKTQNVAISDLHI